MINKETCLGLLDYSPVTGVFTWKKSRGNTAQVGAEAGATDSKGYRQIRVNGRLYMAHRLAWLITHGAWPAQHIDHIDRNPLNNAIANLRECTAAQNQQNVGVRADSTSGVTGVSWLKAQRKWLAYINVKGKMIRLGLFTQFEDAVAARVAGKQAFHPFGAERGVDFNQR